MTYLCSGMSQYLVCGSNLRTDLTSVISVIFYL